MIEWLKGLLGISGKRAGGSSTPPRAEAHGEAEQTSATEHAVLLYLRLGNETFGLPGEVEQMHALQAELEDAIAAADAGELDGDEFGGGQCIVFMYGPDADALWAAIESTLRGKVFRPGSYAIKRYGPPDTARQDRVELT